MRPELKASLSEIELTCIALEGNPENIKFEHVNFKVFYDEDDSKDLYFEMYAHVDIPGGFVSLDEKDESYRNHIASTFAMVQPRQQPQ